MDKYKDTMIFKKDIIIQRDIYSSNIKYRIVKYKN